MKGKVFLFGLLGFLFLLHFMVLGQTSAEPEMADTLRSNGKIYVVVLTVLMVLFGMIAYLLFLEKKISKLEKKLNSK
jgi:hypothetical protein